MAHIEKTAHGTYKVRYRDDANRARSKTFKRKVEAERFSKSVSADVMRGEYVDPRDKKVGFTQLADSWWVTTVALAPSTRHGYRQLLDLHVLPHFGPLAQGSIDVAMMKRFVAEKLEAGYSPKRVADMVSIVSLIMKNAIDDGVRRDNPAAGINVPRRKKKVRTSDMITLAQVRAIVEHIRHPYGSAIWLLVFCGLRPSELCGLKVKSIDFIRCELTVTTTLIPLNKGVFPEYGLHEGPPKTNAGERTIPIPQWLVDDLSAMLAERGERTGPNDWLFESGRAGRPLNRDVFRQWVVVPAMQKAGVPTSFRNYDFRHLHASILIEAGASLLEIAYRMGHVDPTVTLKVYGHLLKNRQDELTDHIDEMVRNAGRAGSDVVDIASRRRSAGE